MGSPGHVYLNVIVLMYLRNEDQISVYYVTMGLPEHAWTCCVSNQSKRLKTTSMFH